MEFWYQQLHQKESHFNADFKYISFIKFSSYPIKSYEPEKICSYFRKQGETPPKSHRILTKITSSDSAYQRTILQKFQAPESFRSFILQKLEIYIFCQKADHGCVFICFFVVFFSPGVIASTPVILKCWQEGSF